MAGLIKTPITTLTLMDKYDTGWIACSDWTAATFTATHNLNAPLSELIVKFLISTDGTDANSFEIFLGRNDGDELRNGYSIYESTSNAVKIYTATQGMTVIDSSGNTVILDTESYYYKIIVYKSNSSPVHLGMDIVIPVGTIQMFGGTSAPAGWFICDGTAKNRTTYANLFSVISTRFGTGDGSTTFNLPDFRAASPVGVGTSTAFTTNETITLGTKYDDQMQGHYHNINQSNGGGAGSLVPGAGSPNAQSTADYALAVDSYRGMGAITDGTNGTPRTGTVTKGKQLGVNFIIKY